MERQRLVSTSFVVKSKTLKLIFVGTLTFLVFGTVVDAPDKPFVLPTVGFAQPEVLSAKPIDRQSFYTERFIPVQLSIPSIGVETAIEAVGIDEQGRMGTPDRIDQVGWYQFGAKAGATGNVVLSGHLDDLNGPAIFADLANIRPGDVVTLRNGEQTANYETVSIKQYRLNDMPLASIFAATQSKRLQLITCAGPYDPQKGYRDRVVVTAQLIE